ncbi:hypothetical protein E1176_17190 [Fulvivirga sp. RKSG066]|uniref:MbnP family protein n=1 Tax=Fulvivirga aurantia TaxID=2529383 RepID=UPI0012BC8BB2|nr:MbnP family protein [Fulvivirga aurantia]MTI22770.1 hypothetical protein [Fulvivirga aurantia]
MKLYNLLTALIIVLAYTSCDSDDQSETEAVGTLQLKFDHFVGTQKMELSEPGSIEFQYETADGEAFNISKFGYYVSEIILEGPTGEYYEDEQLVSALEVKGFYHVLQDEPSSRFITLSDVPAGRYNRVTFKIGVSESAVQEGAAGGVLDPAEGAWFWNWNAGYIGFAIEGTAQNSGQELVEGDGWTIPEKSFALHIGGWKDIEVAEGENQKFVNNVKTIALQFDSDLRVESALDPNVHIVVDLLKMLDGANINFANSYSIHAPKAGQPLAEVLPEVFIVDHTHQ